MGLSLCVLGSGSSGNTTYVGTETTRILVDAGLSGRETRSRLESIGVDPGSLNAICLTHEHGDHVSAIGVLNRSHRIPLYANSATIGALEQLPRKAGLSWNVFTPGARFAVGDITLMPFSVPHDSYDPVGFIVSHGESSAGIATDMGTATELIRERLRNCQVVIVESNHDEQLLRGAERPWSLKQRIAGRQGHMSNRQAGELIRDIVGPRLKYVFLAHLSAECNRPELAEKAMREMLDSCGSSEVKVRLTYPDRPAELVSW